MRAFEVSLNDQKLCLAGVGDDGVLTTIVTRAARKGHADLFLYVGGIVNPQGEHVKWINQKPLGLGDKIQVQIVEVESVDEPQTRRREDPAERLKLQKRYVRRLAKDLGWEVRARPEKRAR